MYEFSQIFKSFIHEKNINVATVISYTQIDRSTIYKYINGKRTPTLEHVEKLSEAMNLTPKERLQFLEAFQMEKLGVDLYNQRKGIENFIKTFPQASNIHKNHLPYVQEHTGTHSFFLYPSEKTCFSLHSSAEVNYCVYHLVMNGFSKPCSKIALFLQPDYDFLFQLLSAIAPTDHPVSVEHIFCLSDTFQYTSDKQLYNLLYLQKVLPLFMTTLNYQAYYYYDNVDSHFSSYNGFPCFLITDEAAMICTSDYRSGIFYDDSSVVSLLWELFNDYKNKCAVLFRTVHSVAEESDILSQTDWTATPCYILQDAPYLIPFITSDMVERYAAHYFSDNTIFPKISNFIKTRRKMISNQNIHIFQTKKGLENFLISGRLAEIHPIFGDSISPEDRLRLLTALSKHCITGHYDLLRGPLECIPGGFHLCVNASSGYLLFNNYKGERIYLFFKEPTFLSIFNDYLMSLDEKYVYTNQEFLDYLKKLIDSYRRTL